MTAALVLAWKLKEAPVPCSAACYALSACRTGRAVSVSHGVFVASRAMRLKNIHGGVANAAQQIRTTRDWFQVLRTNAQVNTAEMIEVQSLRDVPDQPTVNSSMCGGVGAAVEEIAVPAIVDGTPPQPTGIRKLNLASYSFGLSLFGRGNLCASIFGLVLIMLRTQVLGDKRLATTSDGTGTIRGHREFILRGVKRQGVQAPLPLSIVAGGVPQ